MKSTIINLFLVASCLFALGFITPTVANTHTQITLNGQQSSQYLPTEDENVGTCEPWVC